MKPRFLLWTDLACESCGQLVRLPTRDLTIRPDGLGGDDYALLSGAHAQCPMEHGGSIYRLRVVPQKKARIPPVRADQEKGREVTVPGPRER